MLSRKDVKIGVAIGGILLAVVFVYMLSSPGNKGVELAKTDTTDQSSHELSDGAAPPAAAADADASHDSSHGADNGDAAHNAGKTPDNNSVNGQTQGGGAAPAPVSASGGATAVPQASPGASDPWETALRTGKVPALMTSTPTATGGPGSDSTTATPAGGAAPGNAATGNVPPGPSPDSARGDSARADAVKSMTPSMPQDSPTTQPTALAARADNAGGATVHVVEMNETYCTIARSTWGRASLYQKLIEANPGVDPRHLRPGMKINIPALKLASAETAPSGNANESSPDRSQGDGIAPGEPGGAAAGGGVITPNPAGGSSAHHEATGGSAAATAAPAAAAPAIPVAPAPVAARSEVSADVSVGGLSSDGTTYTVQSGDSLYKIAKRLYGTGNGVVKIYNANKDVIGPNMAKLSVGMVLKLPEAPTKLAKAS